MGVLSVSKLRVGQEAYHLSGVAQSLDAYYTGSGEAAGVWVGGSAQRLNLAGEVDPDDLRAVLAGLAPETGGFTPNGETQRPSARRVPGFDLTFKAPKSASVLYAVSDDPRVQGAVIEAGEAAVRAAVEWLEHHSVRVRRGSNNKAFLAAHPDIAPAQEVSTYGMVAASFRHRTSRAGDPLLHWHVLVANLAQGLDGRWSSIVHPNLYRAAKAAGEVFQAVYREQLSASLGVQWRPGRHVGEIAGIPDAVLDVFSKRSQEVEDWLTATGAPATPEGRQDAVLATRRNKPELEHGRFDEEWKREAVAAGWGPDAAETLIASCTPVAHDAAADVPWRVSEVLTDDEGNAVNADRVVDTDEWVAEVLRELTAADTTFGVTDLHAAIARRHGGGTTLGTIERVAHMVLGSAQTVSVDDDRWTSREVLDIENRFIEALDVPVASLDTPSVDDRLGADQAAAVEGLVSTGRAVSVLIGPAGTGKTFTVAAVASAYRANGFDVFGAAPSARAALELDAVGVPSQTLHRFNDDHMAGRMVTGPNSLLVVDEAGMADLRTLERAITAQLRVGGRVLLVGDHHQLPEVGAGGGFAYAVEHASCVNELAVNRRQLHEWEHDALRQLRSGDVAAAVDAYLDHDRVTVTDSPAAMIATAVDTWFAARSSGERAVLLAATTATVDALNTAIARRLHADGELDGTSIMFAGREFRCGERIVIRRNATEHTTDGTPIAIANGQVGTIEHATGDGLAVRLDTGPTVVLTERYLQRGGHVDHAWALTTHRAQGGTWDTAIAVGVDGLYRQGAYVQLSRGALTNRLIITDTEIAALHRTRTDLARHDSALLLPGEEAAELRDDLIDRLTRSAAKHLAHHHNPDATLIDRFAHHHSVPELDALHERAVRAEHDADTRTAVHGPDLAARAEHLAHIATHIAVGERVSPTDRHNVGIVTAVDDHHGTAEVHFVSEHGRETSRTFHFEQLRLVDLPSSPRPMPLGVQATFDELHRNAEQWATIVREHGVEPGDSRRYQHAITQRIDTDTHLLLADPPAWLIDLLGTRPTDVAGATTYDDAVRQIAAWRARHDGAEHGYVGTARRSWAELVEGLEATRTWLDTPARHSASAVPARGFTELDQRLHELEAILDTAPPDLRSVIDRLASGELSWGDTDTLLAEALTSQQHRRDWILEHWPHVVEHHEVVTALANHTGVMVDHDTLDPDRTTAGHDIDI